MMAYEDIIGKPCYGLSPLLRCWLDTVEEKLGPNRFSSLVRDDTSEDDCLFDIDAVILEAWIELGQAVTREEIAALLHTTLDQVQIDLTKSGSGIEMVERRVVVSDGMSPDGFTYITVWAFQPTAERLTLEIKRMREQLAEARSR